MESVLPSPFSLLCIGGSSFVSTGSVLPGVRVPHNASSSLSWTHAVGLCPEATCMCRETLGFWLFTSPFSLSWAPIACRKEVMNCWGTASRKVPVSTMAWQPSEHQSVAWSQLQTWQRHQYKEKVRCLFCSHEPCPPLITHQFRSSNILHLPGSRATLWHIHPRDATGPLWLLE